MKNVPLALEILKSGTQDRELLGLSKVVLMEELKDDDKIGEALERFGDIAFAKVVEKVIEKPTDKKNDDGSTIMEMVGDGVETIWDNKDSLIALFG